MKEKLFNFIKNYYVFIIALLAAAAAFIYIMPPFNADIINYDSAYQYFLTRLIGVRIGAAFKKK